jgi:hypothetical protein
MGVARSLYIRPCMLWVAGFGADKKGFVFGIVVRVAFFPWRRADILPRGRGKRVYEGVGVS